MDYREHQSGDAEAQQLYPAGIAELISVSPQVKLEKRLQDPAVLGAKIAGLAGDVMTDELSDIHVIDGVKYRVSKGNEHFPELSNGLDRAYGDKPHLLGFRLVQEYRSKNQQHIPIKLVESGHLLEPIATIRTSYPSVHQGADIEPTSDQKELETYLQVIAAIKIGSLERLEDERQQKIYARKRLVRRSVGVLAAASVLLVGGITGPTLKTSFDEYRQEQAEIAQIEEARQQEQLRLEQLERDQSVRDFDRAYDIEDGISFTDGEIGIAQPSSQFGGVDVPDYGQEDISAELASDITQPREITLELDDSSCQTVGLPLRSGESLKVVHTGSEDQVYSFSTDTVNDTFRICSFGSMHGNGADVSTTPADSIVIQRQP